MSLQGSFPPVNLPPGVFPAAEYAELLLESARFQLHNLQSCYWKAHVSSCCICRAVTGRRNFQLQNMQSCYRKAQCPAAEYAELLPEGAISSCRICRAVTRKRTFAAAEYAELLPESARFSCRICRAVTGRRNFQLQNMPSCCRKAHVSSCRIYAELLPKSARLQLQNMQSCCQNAHVCSFKGRIVVGKWLFATANLSIIMFCSPVQLCDALNALLETEL